MSLYLYLALKDKKMPKYIIYIIMSDVYDIYDIIKMNAMPLIKLNINKILETDDINIIKHIYNLGIELNNHHKDIIKKSNNYDVINFMCEKYNNIFNLEFFAVNFYFSSKFSFLG